MNYEAFRAMYEGRNAKLFAPDTGIITWMSNPAQPSFVWQLYHYDLEPNASEFAVKSAGELVHIQLNEADGHLEVINNLPTPIEGDTAHMTILRIWGNDKPALEQDYSGERTGGHGDRPGAGAAARGAVAAVLRQAGTARRAGQDRLAQSLLEAGSGTGK